MGEPVGVLASILMRSYGRWYLAKNVALYEEIFYTLARDEVIARRPISSRS